MNYYFQNQNKLSISNILILISLLWTLLVITYPGLVIFWMNKWFLSTWNYNIYILQYFTYSFLHGWAFHFLTNSLFIYLFGNIVEQLLWKKKYILLVIFVTIFNWIIITWLSNANTIWISGFAMALLTYYTLKLREKNNQEYKWWITALILNIWIWLLPWISLIWHFSWVVAWFIFYILTKDFFKKAFVS